MNYKTGLFSATVGAFIIASYPMLSPASGDQTVFILQQISQQLSGLANGTVVTPKEYPPFSPSTQIVCVNAMWILSLIISIACALLATMMQQWARQYVQLPQLRTIPRERAYVRSFLFLGLERFHMPYMVELIPTLLHLSVFLFFVGLVIFLFTIFTTVAIIISVSVGIFSVAYIALTILPCASLNCPYRTPLSNLSWTLWHTFMHVIMSLAIWVEDFFHNSDYVKFRNKLEGCRQVHHLRRKAGLSRSVASGAQSAPENRDLHALNWFLRVPALSEDTTFQDFVSTLTDDMIQRMLQSSDPQSDTLFGSRLHDLLWTCLPDSTGLTGDARKHRLLTCLDAIYNGFKAYNVDESDTSIPDNIRVNFAELRIMRPLWSDGDTAVSIRARCVCALLARRILRDIGGPARRRIPTEADVAWLGAVFGESGPSSNGIYNSLGDLKVMDSANVTSFVRGVKSPLLTGKLTNKEIASILDTLTILMDAKDISRRSSFQERIWFLIQRAETSDNLQQLVSPLLQHLREAFPVSPADVGVAPSPSMSMPVPTITIPVPRPHS